MSSIEYRIYNKARNLYVHFNPNKNVYFCSPKVKDSCIFIDYKAIQFIKGLDPSWSLVEANRDSQN